MLDALSANRRDEDASTESACATRSAACRSLSDLQRLIGAGANVNALPELREPGSQVKDSRPTEDSAAIRRRRVFPACNFRFTTFERVQLRELIVIKRNGRRAPSIGTTVALASDRVAQRPVEPERSTPVFKIVRDLEGSAKVKSRPKPSARA